MVIFNDIQTIFYPSFVVIIQRHQGNVSASTGLWLPVGGGAESRIQSEFHVVLIIVRCECTGVHCILLYTFSACEMSHAIIIIDHLLCA